MRLIVLCIKFNGKKDQMELFQSPVTLHTILYKNFILNYYWIIWRNMQILYHNLQLIEEKIILNINFGIS